MKTNYHVEFDIDFKRNHYPGKLVVLEGIDGSGKTTQTHKVADTLNKKGIKAVFTKEPTDRITGKLIHEFLTGKIALSPVALQYLFAADRAVHQEEIESYLKQGFTVVSDRYFWSSVTYGMIDKNIDFSKALSNADYILTAYSILSMYNQFIVPNKTFYLDVSVQTALARLKEKNTHAQAYEKKANLEKLVKGYNWLAKKFPKEIVVIDAEGEVGKVTQEIIEKLT